MHAQLRNLLLGAATLALFAAAPAQAQYGLTNQVLQLDGTGDYLNVTGTLPSFSTQLTAEAWIKTSVASGNQAIIARFNNNSNSFSDDSFQLSVANGRARWQINVGNNAANAIMINGSTFVADGNWHHVAGVYNGIHVALVVDGVIDAPQVAATTSANNPAATPLRIGAALVNGVTGFYFNGQIDEVRLWDAAHAATTIINYRLIPFRDRTGRYPVRMSWRMNGSGDTGTGNLLGNAQLVTPSTPVPVYSDTFLRLDGDQEFVRIPSSSSVRSSSAITVEAWVRPLSTGSLRSVVSKYTHNSGSNADDEYFLGFEADGRARFQISTQLGFAIVNGSENLSLDDHWHHLAGVYDGQAITLYVDGVFQQATALTGSIQNTALPVYIGATKEGVSQADSGFFHGNIDDVRIWDRALTGDELNVDVPGDEIDDGMNSCWSGPRSGLIARYLFEGDFLNRATLTTTQAGHGQPRGSAERMLFVGPRSFGQGSCH
jgi:hypothetical protein